MKFQFYRDTLAQVPVLSVDGICPLGPNLSHWPGNRTPAHLKHDLSTGIVLKFAALSKKERDSFLQGIEVVSNNHYDTDGFLSIWTALNPEKALRFSSRLLHAAEAGDFSVAPSAEAVKLDLIVSAFSDPTKSPIGLELWNLSEEDRHERCYQALLEMMPRLLDQVQEFKALWREPFARFEESHENLRARGSVRKYTDIDFAVIESDRDEDMRALQTVAQADRVLFVQHTPEGNLYHFWYAVTSWFELVSVLKPKRISLEGLAHSLNRQCPGDAGKWHGEGLELPIANLFFGERKKKAQFLELPGNRLPHPMLCSKIEEIFVSAFREGLPHD